MNRVYCQSKKSKRQGKFGDKMHSFTLMYSTCLTRVYLCPGVYRALVTLCSKKNTLKVQLMLIGSSDSSVNYNKNVSVIMFKVLDYCKYILNSALHKMFRLLLCGLPSSFTLFLFSLLRWKKKESLKISTAFLCCCFIFAFQTSLTATQFSFSFCFGKTKAHISPFERVHLRAAQPVTGFGFLHCCRGHTESELLQLKERH